MIVLLYVYQSRTEGEHARKHTSGPSYYFEYAFLEHAGIYNSSLSSNSAHYGKAKGQVWKEYIPRATQQQRAIPSSEDWQRTWEEIVKFC